ncbi:MAG: hypothetical protein M5U19_18050 [Microthrixaceae bacterium]|nr:hypothetical protein [Microthrixaceae bacterium]
MQQDRVGTTAQHRSEIEAVSKAPVTPARAALHGIALHGTVLHGTALAPVVLTAQYLLLVHHLRTRAHPDHVAACGPESGAAAVESGRAGGRVGPDQEMQSSASHDDILHPGSP